MPACGARATLRASRKIEGTDVTPEEAVTLAKRYGCEGIAYTYNQPTIFLEYAHDVGVIARQQGIFNVFVSNGYDTPDSLKQTRAGSGASFPLLSDTELTVTRLYDMQLRAGWPMAGMGEIPEMGYVVVDSQGLIRLQRVDIHFGDHVDDILQALQALAP